MTVPESLYIAKDAGVVRDWVARPDPVRGRRWYVTLRNGDTYNDINDNEMARLAAVLAEQEVNQG